MPFLLNWLDWVYFLPLLFMDVVILYSTAKLLNAETAVPLKYIRWIYLSGLAAMIIFIIIRLLKGLA